MNGAAERSTSESCVACHRTGGTAPADPGHPVGVDYEARRAGSAALRPAAEVVKRGVFLPGGKIECLTCHDPASPYRNHIVLPPGLEPAIAVNPRDRSTYADPTASAARSRALKSEAQAGLRPAITPRPLCLACHAVD